jgi:hypothetical protein
MDLRFPLAAVAIVLATNAHAQTLKTITFDEPAQGFVHGSRLAGNEYAADGVLISVKSNGARNQGIIFDTNATGTADNDLEAPFSGGNLAGSTDLGNALIIAENLIDSNNDSIIDSPDDEARGGAFRFEFRTPIETFGFSLYDTPEDNSERALLITFDDGGGNSAELTLSDLIALNPGAEFANHYANSFNPVTLADTGLSQFSSVTVEIAGSGAIDTLTYTVVPEPSTALLGAFTFLFTCLRRRR